MNEKEPLIDLLIHDLTGPLSIVSTSVHSLLKKEETCKTVTDEQRATLERILRNANKARSLLQEMIEIYRSEEGLFRKAHFSIDDVIQSALLDAVEITDPALAEKLACSADYKIFRHILDEHGIHVEVTGAYSTSPFAHDQKKIEQILRNLLTNALKYRKTYINLSVSGDMDLVIAVEDDGSGIPKEKQDYVFRRFFQQKNRIKSGAEGLGFGLSCVKALVETMHGDITLKSGEGKGTCFTVRIPPL